MAEGHQYHPLPALREQFHSTRGRAAQTFEDAAQRLRRNKSEWSLRWNKSECRLEDPSGTRKEWRSSPIRTWKTGPGSLFMRFSESGAPRTSHGHDGGFVVMM